MALDEQRRAADKILDEAPNVHRATPEEYEAAEGETTVRFVPERDKPATESDSES